MPFMCKILRPFLWSDEKEIARWNHRNHLQSRGPLRYLTVLYPSTPCMPYMPTLTPKPTPTDRQSYGSPMGRAWDMVPSGPPKRSDTTRRAAACGSPRCFGPDGRQANPATRPAFLGDQCGARNVSDEEGGTKRPERANVYVVVAG